MSNVIQIKRGQSAPPNGTLYPGELGVNMASGVLYIGSNKTDADGNYISTFPYAYRLRSTAGIQTTEDQEEGVSDFGPYMSLRFLNSQEQTRGSIMVTSKNRINLNCQVTGSNYADRYLLPEPTTDLIEDKWYNILTSKNVVTVAQGGTGQISLTSGHVLIGNGTGAVASRAIKNNTTTGDCDWSNATGTANGTNLITLNTLAFWNGRYNGTSSNLAYCSKGEFGNAAIKNVTSSVTSGSADLVTSGGVYAKCANYLPLSGGVLTDTLTLPANKHYTQTALGYALNCSNSDIVNANGIWFLDKTDSNTEGLHFLNTSGTDTKHWTTADDRTWDTLYAVGGQLKFHPNRGSFDSLGGYQVFHSGNYRSPYANIFHDCQLNSESPKITITFNASSATATGINIKHKSSFLDYSFYLFMGAFNYTHDGITTPHYKTLLVPISQLYLIDGTEYTKNFVLNLADDIRYFSVTTKKSSSTATGIDTMIIQNVGAKANGFVAGTFLLFGIK